MDFERRYVNEFVLKTRRFNREQQCCRFTEMLHFRYSVQTRKPDSFGFRSSKLTEQPKIARIGWEKVGFADAVTVLRISDKLARQRWYEGWAQEISPGEQLTKFNLISRWFYGNKRNVWCLFNWIKDILSLLFKNNEISIVHFWNLEN